MNKTPAPALQTDTTYPQQLGSPWLTTLGSGTSGAHFGSGFSVDHVTVLPKTLSLAQFINSIGPACAERPECAVVFDGNLYNQADLESALGFSPTTVIDDAQLILHGCERWGEQLLKRLRGAFALLIWDKARELLLCLRDPLGTYPLFY